MSKHCGRSGSLSTATCLKHCGRSGSLSTTTCLKHCGRSGSLSTATCLKHCGRSGSLSTTTCLKHCGRSGSLSTATCLKHCGRSGSLSTATCQKIVTCKYQHAPCEMLSLQQTFSNKIASVNQVANPHLLSWIPQDLKHWCLSVCQLMRWPTLTCCRGYHKI